MFGLRLIWTEKPCDCPELRFALDGLIDIVSGPRFTDAEPDFVELIVLVAVTVTVVWFGIAAGAVYSPEVLTVPTLGFTDQVTSLVAMPPERAVNCCVPSAKRFWLEGVSERFAMGG